MAIYFLITILIFTIPPNLHSEELREICTTNTRCELTKDYPLITNHGTTIITPTRYTGYDGGIYIQQEITSFINYGEIITNTKDGQRGIFSFTFNGGNIKTLTNYGTLSGGVNANASSIHITNYGKMGGASTKGTVTIANYGEINLLNGDGKKYHFKDIQSLTLQHYAMKINERADKFNSFDGNAEDNSHLILGSYTSVKFADKNSKLILDFGDSFEFGAGYLFSKLVVDTSGNNKLSVDFDRLIPKNDIYTLYKQGDYFIARLQPQHSAISNISKSNIRTMNNFYTLSNSMIYPRKSYHSQNLGNPSLRADSQNLRGNPLIKESLDSTIPLKSYESFSYRNESVNRRIQRQNKRNYNRKSQNQVQNLKENQRPSQNLAQNPNYSQTPHNYYFILTPFFNYNSFTKSGNYNLSGFDYGFLTAFSTQVAESNSLGAHFIFSYGTLGDSKDKDLSIKSLNLNLGINYKLDLVWDMYLKARGDFYYFSNALDSLTIKNIKPNNLGFGASVIFGKDFDFGKGGVLGIEAGLDYKALQSNTISLQNNATKTISETYNKSLYNLIYVDLGMSYNKYFGNFGLNAGLGIKGNITANKLATSKIHISTFNKSVDMMLDNDNFLGYANLGASYVLNHKDFDMEFSVAYYGNFGDRVISNGGGVEWRVGW